MATTVKVKLNQDTINRELHSRDGAVGKVLAGFGGVATKAVKQKFQRRAGGAYWRTTSSIKQGRELQLQIEAQRTRPHVITPRRAGGVLVFEVPGAGTVFARRVNHPGSSPPAHLIEEAVREAGRSFAYLAPR